MIGPIKREGDRQQAAKGMADQYQWPTTFRASTDHDAIDVVEQRAEAGRVAALTSAAPMPAVVHGVDGGAASRKPFREVLVATAVFAQAVRPSGRGNRSANW